MLTWVAAGKQAEVFQTVNPTLPACITDAGCCKFTVTLRVEAMVNLNQTDLRLRPEESIEGEKTSPG